MHESMPTGERIRLAQEVYAAFSRGDIDSILGKLTDDVVWSEPENPFNPAGGTRCGHEGFLEWVRIGHEAEEIEQLEPKRFLVDQSGVAIVGHLRCRARATGRIYESDFVHLLTIRDGKISAFQEFFDTYTAGEAFRA